MTLNELVAAVKEGSDASTGRIEQWINDRYRRMVVEARWRKVERTIGSTAAGVDTYAVEASMVELLAVRVDQTEYVATSLELLWAIADPTQSAGLQGAGGVFAPTFGEDSTPAIKLYPVPTEDGLTITGRMVYIPEPLRGDDEPMIPLDLHDALLAGAIAESLTKIDARADLAQTHEADYAAGIETLRRRATAQLAPGPAQARIRGIHF